MTGSGITVVGTGTADVVPDVADWSFGVSSQAATASDALSANASAMKAIIDSLKSAGVSKEDLQTTQVSLYPETADDGRTVTGYSASSTVTATVRKLGDAGKVVDAAVRAGANDVYGPNLHPSDTDAQYREAVDKAFDDARAHAEAIAAKAGVSLGSPTARDGLRPRRCSRCRDGSGRAGDAAGLRLADGHVRDRDGSLIRSRRRISGASPSATQERAWPRA
jgi:uncharacterized protein YggE